MEWGVRFRVCVCLAVAVTTVRAAAPPTAGSDLHGTARAHHRPLARAVVWLEAHDARPTEAARPVVLNQTNLTFSPDVIVVRVGTVVEFPNNDRVFHNVFSFRDGKRFDLGVYPVGARRRVVFDRPGVSRIFCNIHPNMAAYVISVDSPYYAVSDDTGAFTIGAVAPGTYMYHAWRSGAKELTGTVTVGTATEPLAIEWP